MTLPMVLYLRRAHVDLRASTSKFKRKHGPDPALLYPALWYDIGPDTEAARVALFGLRAELMARGLSAPFRSGAPRTASKSPGIPRATSTAAGGCERRQPLFYRNTATSRCSTRSTTTGTVGTGFKLISSAAFTYDRPLTAVEIYGNYPDNSVDKAMLYRSAMEVFARGANRSSRTGCGMTPAKMHIPPEISHRNPRWGAELPAYNRFVGRCSLLLQGGRHVADLGMLYPWWRYRRPTGLMSPVSSSPTGARTRRAGRTT